MSRRPATAPRQVHRNRWIWGYDIPWLPDLLANPEGATLTGNAILEAFGRQIAFLRAVAAGAPAGSALQLRFLTDSVSGDVTCHLLGGASDERDADLLGRIVATALPPELPLEAMPAGVLEPTLRAVDPDGLQPGDAAEIRRAVDRLDPTVEHAEHDDTVLFPWTWSPQAMLASLGLLRQQHSRTTLAVHVQPDALPPAVAVFLQDEIDRLASDLRDGEEQPLTVAVVRAYRRWLRLLPKSCVTMRVLVAAQGPLVPGLAESLSTDLTRSFEGRGDPALATADVVMPEKGGELDACAQLLDELRGVPWRAPAHRELARLLHLFDPLEANTAFRFPVAPRGGLPGVASQRLSALDRANDARPREEATIELGSTPAGGRYGLTRRDLNQHVLVAGLPGFGKTSTTQLLLRRAHEQLDGLPFLVIDPAKSDYGALFAALKADGVDIGVHRLTPEAVAFNPLAVPDGVAPATYAGRVVAAFETALDLSGWNPLALVFLQRAVQTIYDRVRDGHGQPTMAELYRTTGDLIRRSAFAPEGRANLEGSLLGRLEVLATTAAGRALLGGPADGTPWATILSRPTLIELGGFAGPAERSLIFALLMAGLVSYREAHPSHGGLAHLTVLEEAHRLLRPAATRDAGVEVFVDAIAELRGAGEGFVIVDQTPSLLHPAILKLTGSKLAHRLVDATERREVGDAMVLDHAQAEDLARLGPQRLIAYAASGATASLVEVDHSAMAGPGPVAPTAVATGLVAEPTEARLQCVGCPVMCEGAAGAARVEELASVVRAAGRVDPHGLLTAAGRITGEPRTAYCLAATTATAMYGRRRSDASELLRGIQQAYARRFTRAREKELAG